MQPIVCTYQGSFSPPTIGHEDAARIIAAKLIELYPGRDITLFFMPTANIGSKESISKKRLRTHFLIKIRPHTVTMYLKKSV
jgi:nicotinic acid mononucleotide adenylyltransferase